jgi:hypothetical protein
MFIADRICATISRGFGSIEMVIGFSSRPGSSSASNWLCNRARGRTSQLANYKDWEMRHVKPWGLRAGPPSRNEELSDVRDSIASRIAAEAKVTTHRLVIGDEFAEAAYRSAANCLSRPGSLGGLGTREAFRVDPTDVDESGEMIGFSALPHILSTKKVPFHYPPRPRAYAPLLPALEEMPELLRRAWTARTGAADNSLDGGNSSMSTTRGARAWASHASSAVRD